MRTRRAGWWGVMIWLTGWAGAAPAEVQEKEFLLGGDISALTKIEEQGGVFYDGGVRGDAIGIMRKYGCNCFRLRLFVNPTKRNVVVNDLAYTIKLAKRINRGRYVVLDTGHEVHGERPGEFLAVVQPFLNEAIR